MQDKSSPLQRMLFRLLFDREQIDRATNTKSLQQILTLFATMVVLPVVLLAILSLRSLGQAESAMMAGLKQRAESIADGVDAEVASTLRELSIDAERVIEGEVSPTTFADRHPSVRAVYELNSDSELVWPFIAANPSSAWVEPPESYRALITEGLRHENRSEWTAAREDFERAAILGADTPSHAAHGRYLQARATSRVNSAEALALYRALTSDPRDLRDPRGLPIADLARIQQAELEWSTRNRRGAIAGLKGLVNKAIANPWPIESRGSGLTAQYALSQLRDHVDPKWHQQASQSIQRRLQQLYWTRQVEDDLNRLLKQPVSDEAFTTTSTAGGLWVMRASQSGTWIFSLDEAVLLEEINTSVLVTANTLEPTLKASLVNVEDDIGPALFRRTLAPTMPYAAVVVRLASPSDLQSKITRTRLLQILVVLLAVISTTAGLLAGLRLIREQLAQASAKTDFAANVSHELRSPLTQIRLKAEMLSLGLLEETQEQEEGYTSIMREADRLSRLIDNVLDFAAIEQGHKKYNLRPTDLGESLARAVFALEDRLDNAGIELDLNIDANMPVVWVDPDAMGQVFANLLSNAIKYGGSGCWLGVSALVIDDGIQFSISDRGVGIADEDQEHIFEHFYRAHAPEVRKVKGTGIGLSIVRYIIDAHGGIIDVESQLGEGTTFTVTLPFHPPSDSGAKAHA